jgi:hypothetical protein
MAIGPASEDQWRWAEALAIEKAHGPLAARYVAERIAALALAGDEAGVARMKQIAARLDQLGKGGHA